MSELKPCPFCGGEAFLNDDPTGNGGKPHMSGNVGLGRLWSVECDECGADAGFWQDRDVAIAAWNTRAERTCRMTDRGECSECGAYIVRAWTDKFPALCRLWLPRNLSKQYGIEPDGFCAWGEKANERNVQ